MAGAALIAGSARAEDPASVGPQSTSALILQLDRLDHLYTGRPDAVVAPSETRVTTLSQAVAYAYQTNPRLLGERATVRSTDYRYPAARSAYGPRLDAGAGYAFTRDRTEIVNNQYLRRSGYASSADLVASLPLLSFGRSAAAVADAEARISYQRDVLRITEAEVLSNVISAYVGVLRDAGAVTIARENLSLLERQLSDNRQRFAVREITATDVEQVETRVELGRAQLLTAQSQLGISQAEFLRHVGMIPGELAQPDVLALPVTTLAQAYGVADAESPIVRAAQSRDKVSRAAIAAAKAEFMPRADLRGTAQYGSVSPYTDSRRTSDMRGEVHVSLPLIDSGLRAAQLGQAREANDADGRLLEAAMRDTRAAVAAAWNELAGARESLGRYRAATEAAARAYSGTVLQEKAGARTTLDTLELARDLLTVRNNYNNALANEYLARAALLSAMGRLEAPMLVPGIPAYDPMTHFRKVRSHGDIPLLTGLLSALDGAGSGKPRVDRLSRDPAGRLAVDAPVPLSKEEAQTPP